MSNQRSTPRDEDLLLQDFSRNVTTKSWALFIGNASIVSAIPLCKLRRMNLSYEHFHSRAFLAYSSNGYNILFYSFYCWYSNKYIFP
jgi:hypothetical protein